MPETLHQRVPVKGPPDHPAQRAEQQFLYQQGTMGFRKQAAIEKYAAGQLDARLVVPRQQFLGNAVTVIVGKHMHRVCDLQVREQRLLQVGLL